MTLSSEREVARLLDDLKRGLQKIHNLELSRTVAIQAMDMRTLHTLESRSKRIMDYCSVVQDKLSSALDGIKENEAFQGDLKRSVEDIESLGSKIDRLIHSNQDAVIEAMNATKRDLNKVRQGQRALGAYRQSLQP